MNDKIELKINGDLISIPPDLLKSITNAIKSLEIDVTPFEKFVRNEEGMEIIGTKGNLYCNENGDIHYDHNMGTSQKEPFKVIECTWDDLEIGDMFSIMKTPTKRRNINIVFAKSKIALISVILDYTDSLEHPDNKEYYRMDDNKYYKIVACD